MYIENTVCICGLITDCLVSFGYTCLLKNSSPGKLFLNFCCFWFKSGITDVYRTYCVLLTDCLVSFGFTFLLKKSCEGKLFLNCKCFLVNSYMSIEHICICVLITDCLIKFIFKFSQTYIKQFLKF